MVINRKVLPWLIAGVALAAILLIVLVMVTQAAPDSAPHRQGSSISPGVVSYQGQVNIGGVPFSGTGYFRFAIVDSGGTVYWSSDSIAPSEYFTECSDWMNYDIGPAGAGNHLWGDVHVFSPTSPYGIHGLVSEIRNVMVVSGSTYINFSTACTGLSDGGNHVWGGNIAEPNGACGDDDNAGCVAIGLTRGHTFNYTTTIEFTCGGDYGYVLNGGIHGSGDETSFDSRVCLIHETDPGPTAAVTLTVVNGLFNALLGETNPITYGMFSDSDRWLRVWFDDGTHGVQLLEPDTRITTAPFAFRSDYAMTALTATYATTADSATTALTATWSTTATYATTADSSTTALTATNATTATYATTALTATNATTSTYATTALTATNATTATYATTALTATNATIVQSSAYSGNTALGARVYTTLVLTVPNGTHYVVPFDSELFDTNSIHSSDQQTMTCNTSGIYMINGAVRFASVLTGTRMVGIWINGVIVASQRIQALTPASAGLVNVSTIWMLNNGDAVTLRAWQDSGISVQIASSGAQSTSDFAMVRIP